MYKKFSIRIALFSILVLGFVLRFYNIGLENLWYDEMISFWVANPKHTILESFGIHNFIERSPFTYHLFLKFFFHFFGYSPEIGRYISAIFGCLFLLTIPFFIKTFKHDKANLFALFLFSFNIFLITFSQEMRVYSMLLFFVSLSYLFFFQILLNKKSGVVFFIFFSLISIFLHPFALLVYFSNIGYLLLRFLKFKKFDLRLILILTFIGIISLVFYYFSFFYFLEPSQNDHLWIPELKIKFFTNFFFSNFFGSRILGIIFLITLIVLIIKNFKIFYKLEIISILLLSLIISYLLPIIFNYIFEPILVSRYMIFVLIPIIFLISILTYNTKNKKMSLFITILLCSITILNLFTEQSFKQFYKPRIIYKAQYLETIKFISNSNYKNYTLKLVEMKSLVQTKNSINNYLSYLGESNNVRINFLDLNNINNNTVWLICPMVINKDCSLPKKMKDFKIIDEKNFVSINLKLLKKT